MDISSQITDQEKHQLEEQFSYFIRNFFPERTTTVLHVAAEKVKNRSFLLRIGEDVNKIIKLKPIHSQIKLILQLGADVNAIDHIGGTPLHHLAFNCETIDRNGRTPLHILARTSENHLENFLLAFQTLVDAGAHLYLAADDGETVISILKKNLMEYEELGEIVDPYFESLINDVFPLTWLCARVIRRHRIPFEDRLPPRLQALVLSRTAQQWYKRCTNHHKFLLLNFFFFIIII
jgi:hypothetical protein